MCTAQIIYTLNYYTCNLLHQHWYWIDPHTIQPSWPVLIPTRLVANLSRLRSLHLSINQTSSPATRQQMVASMLNQPKPRYPDPSRPECLSRHILPILWQTWDSPSLVYTSWWSCLPQKNTDQGAHTLTGPVCYPRWSQHPSRTSLLPKVIPTPLQD